MDAISAVIIVKNEAENIQRVCRSLKWCDEIVVVDCGSDDGTVGLAEAAGARVVFRKFDGYGTQKAFAVSQARNRWILSVDADEEVSAELRDSILALPQEDRMSGYFVTRVDKFNGKILKHTLGSYRKILRLFDRERGNFNTLSVHESVEIEGRTGTLKGLLLHYSYRDIKSYFSKFNTYTSMQAQLNFERGKRTSPFQVLIRFPLAVLDAVIVKKGFLDGYEGILMGIFHALYSTVKYAKLLELQKVSSD